ncbi:MAG TPA: hypothetical protein VGS97_10900 [Actinocrinis sp.]|uniref:hypothetical protein n=1 Tax=Actinocrinis sp. TaxID=1920516 RepID=UPI002DDD5572|nr:hypothetical protein [Actinocrinis sp.]HEV2344591.1 hypothetical protein [Actinocrinis sp.]
MRRNRSRSYRPYRSSQSSHRRRRTRGRVTILALGLGIAVVPLPANGTQPAALPNTTIPNTATPNNALLPGLDLDLGALQLSTTTDTLPADEAASYETIAGDPVQRVYAVRNRGLLALRDVSVSDPDANGAAMRCGPHGTPTLATLPPLSSSSCTVAFAAMQGKHHSTVTATGTVTLLDVMLSDADRVDYTAVVPALSASLSLGSGQSSPALPVGSPVPATVTVLNAGSVPLSEVSAQDPPPLSDFSCGDGGAIVERLDAGESVACNATLTPAPGVHVSRVTITGNWVWDRPLTAQGPQPSRVLRVQTVAEASYTGVPVPSTPPAPTPVVTPSIPPPTSAAARSTPAAVLPPAPSPRLSPSPAPTPTPTPTKALLQPVSAFQRSRGISLPLKVLVIVIIPAVAAATGARRIASRR